MTDVARIAVVPAAGSERQVVRWTDTIGWDRFVDAASDGTLAHLWGWRDVVTGTYGHHVINLAAVCRGGIVGVLPLVLVRSRLFGRSLVSVPYLDSGGLCTDGDRAAEAALMAAAMRLSEQHRARLDLRHQFDKDLCLPASLEKVTFVLDINGGEDVVFSRIRSNRRGQIRKARKHGLTTRLCGIEGVEAFYGVWAANMRDLGSPVHPRSFFERVLAAFPERARVVLVEDGSEAIGAGIILRHGDRVVLPWSSSLRASLAKGPNQLLYWEAIRHAISTGAASFDFGRSSRGSGTFDSKREWGAEPVQLYWHGSDDVSGSSRIDQLEWATRVWRRLPVPVTIALGSRVRGGITR